MTAAVKDAIAVLRDCIDSLEYVNTAHPEATGYGVRRERAAKAREVIDQLRQHLAEGWQAIETAPKDGRYVLLYGTNFDGGCAVACWMDDGWHLDDGKNFEIPIRAEHKLTHWMPLPVAPQPPADKGE